MCGNSSASVCERQSIFAPASPGAPALVVEEGALAARKRGRCWDACVAWAAEGAASGNGSSSCLSLLGYWHGGLFAASTEMHPLTCLCQWGLGALGAGGETLVTLIATSQCFTRHMTRRAALRSALLRGCCSSASPGPKAGPLCPGWTACHLLPLLQNESMWARGHVDRLLLH